MFNKLSFLPAESHYPVRLALDDENIFANEEQNTPNNANAKPFIDVPDVIADKIEKAKQKSSKPIITQEDIDNYLEPYTKKAKQKIEFNNMLKAALKEHVTIKCHNNGSYIRVRVYFDDDEICMGSCEADV